MSRSREVVGHTAKRAQQRQQRGILAFGDSLTAGFCKGGDAFFPYTTQLSKMVTGKSAPLDVRKRWKNAKIEEAGSPGETVAMMNHFDRLGGLLSEKAGKGKGVLPSIVLIMVSMLIIKLMVVMCDGIFLPTMAPTMAREGRMI